MVNRPAQDLEEALLAVESMIPPHAASWFKSWKVNPTQSINNRGIVPLLFDLLGIILPKIRQFQCFYSTVLT